MCKIFSLSSISFPSFFLFFLNWNKFHQPEKKEIILFLSFLSPFEFCLLKIYESSHCHLENYLIWALIQPTLLHVETPVTSSVLWHFASSSGSVTPVRFALLHTGEKHHSSHCRRHHITCGKHLPCKLELNPQHQFLTPLINLLPASVFGCYHWLSSKLPLVKVQVSFIPRLNSKAPMAEPGPSLDPTQSSIANPSSKSALGASLRAGNTDSHGGTLEPLLLFHLEIEENEPTKVLY